MGCTASKQTEEERVAEDKRVKAQQIVQDSKAAHADVKKPIDADAAVKIQKMFRRSATQRAVKFQTNWQVISTLPTMCVCHHS